MPKCYHRLAASGLNSMEKLILNCHLPHVFFFLSYELGVSASFY